MSAGACVSGVCVVVPGCGGVGGRRWCVFMRSLMVRAWSSSWSVPEEERQRQGVAGGVEPRPPQGYPVEIHPPPLFYTKYGNPYPENKAPPIKKSAPSGALFFFQIEIVD